MVCKREERLNKSYVLNSGEEVIIIEYFNASNITILFSNGDTLSNTTFNQLKKGNVKNPKARVGEKHTTNQGYEIEIVESFGTDNCTVVFKDGALIKGLRYENIKRGEVENPYRASVCGIGYFGIGNYTSILSKAYGTWSRMFERCYDEKCQGKYPTYKGCYVDSYWHNFQNFAEWHEENWKPYMEGWHLDKDILIKGNKIYSSTTCAFVPQEVNKLFTKRIKNIDGLPICVRKRGKKFTAQVTSKVKSTYLGSYDTSEEAFQAYKIAKEQHIKEVADKWKGQITETCYRAMYNWEVEITD